jgi:hypothetical protein
MGDYTNSNLCGASASLNDVLSKLDSAKADIKSKLNEVASTAAAAFGEAQNELAGLIGKLQSIEIPTLPKLNLQAEIASLASLIPGTPSFLSALAKIKLEFEDDIKAAGLELNDLVSSAISAITDGGNLCEIVPNLQKEAGSDVPAVEEPAAGLLAGAKATTELPSVSNQNANLDTRVVENDERLLGNLLIALETTAKTISDEAGNISKVIFPGTSNNVAPDGTGFIHKPGYINYDADVKT